MTTKRPFAELLTGLQTNKLSLTDVIAGLNERGAVQSPLHKAELAMLDEALAKNKLDEKLHRLLTTKLKEVQAARASTTTTGSRPAGNSDKTVVAGAPVVEKTAMYSAYKGGAEDKTALNPNGGAADAKTVMNPAGAAGDRTTINPATGNGADDPDKTAMADGGGGGDGFDLLIGSEDEKTEMGGEAAATTGFKPSEPATASRTGGTTGGKSGPNTSSWQKVAASHAPDREVHAGDILKDRFFLEKEVGRGGMGIVFKARDERKIEAQDKNPWVAVKILNPEFRKHPQALVALQRESRKAQQLTHDNILRVYDFDKDGTVIYMTMEYCDAGALKDWIKKHPSGMPFEKGLPIIEGLARGLGRAHRDNIVHSDFKPGNVMMTADGTPKLFDLGIARAAKSGGESKGETTVFDAGELGALTPAYASLEMIQGQPPELIDDIYALGITAYEILTGKHPFNKKNAEQAMKEGLKPPVVPGLGRLQKKTLEASIAFKREDRIKSCDAFIDGMRPRSLKDYAVPIMGAGVAAILLLVGVFGGLLPYLKNRRIDALGQQFQQAVFADDAAALAAIAAMNPEEADTAKVKYSKDIQNYFFAVANKKWDLAAKPPRYDNPGAVAVVKSAETLFPDSAAVATNLRKLDDEKKQELVRLDTEFNARIDANQIYEDKKDNIVETVAVIRQIDPGNDLLKDKKLNGRYTNDIRAALEAGQYEVADKRAATAVKVFPGDKELLALQRNVTQGHEMQLAAAKERELREKMTATEAKTELAKLAANPLFTPEWQVNVNVAMSKLTGDTTPETTQVKSSLAEAYARQLASKVDAKDLVAGQMVADASGKLFPGMPSLMREIGRLNEARKAQQKEEAEKAAVAEADTLKRTLKTKADANDLRGAQAALDKLKAYLPANDPFLSGDGPKALADAYLRQANKLAEQGRYDAAQQFVENGLKVVPNMQSLKDAQKTYRVEGFAATVETATASPATASGERVKSALEALRGEDQARWAKVVDAAQANVLTRLQAMTKTDPAGAGKGKAEWLKVFPQNTQLASLVIPEATAPVASTTTAAASSTTPSLPKEARAARPHGVETCQTSFSTYGRNSKATCQDDLGGGLSGPKLVVVPSVSGGYMAITKYEITVGQFDAFCSATGKCRPQGGNEALPRTGISLSLAKAYAAWLSEKTGFNYRVPTDAEWANAANAGGAGAGEDFQCIVNAGGSQIKGGNAIPVSTGKPNPWGLVNVIGNVAEFTDGGSARGGHFNTPTSQCTVDWKQGGSESDTIGVRLVRDMG